MSEDCSLRIDRFLLRSGAYICMHKNYHHVLYYKPERLTDLCVNHYCKRYMTVDKTELTDIPNWRILCGDKYNDELEFIMLLCKENVSD